MHSSALFLVVLGPPLLLAFLADVHGVISEDKNVNELHNNAERFDRKTEVAFKYLQVCGGAGVGGWRGGWVGVGGYIP